MCDTEDERTCSYCGNVYQSSRACKRHAKEIHERKNFHKCQHCSSRIQRRHNLLRHIERYHTKKVKKARCTKPTRTRRQNKRSVPTLQARSRSAVKKAKADRADRTSSSPKHSLLLNTNQKHSNPCPPPKMQVEELADKNFSSASGCTLPGNSLYVQELVLDPVPELNRAVTPNDNDNSTASTIAEQQSKIVKQFTTSLVSLPTSNEINSHESLETMSFTEGRLQCPESTVQ